MLINFMRGIIMLGLIVVLHIVITGKVSAAELPQGIIDRGLSVVDMIGQIIGIRNAIAIILVNMVVRAYRAKKYREEHEIVATLKKNSVGFGVGIIILTSDLAAIGDWTAQEWIVFVQAVAAAPFITYWGAIGLYEAVRAALIYRITDALENGRKVKGLKRLFFMVDPSPIRAKGTTVNGDAIIEIEPDVEFTRFSDTIFRRPVTAPEKPEEDTELNRVLSEDELLEITGKNPNTRR